MMMWLSATRYYRAELMRDLLGDLVVWMAWGGRYNRRGGNRNIPVQDEDAGASLIAAIDRRRLRRGYDMLTRK